MYYKKIKNDENIDAFIGAFKDVIFSAQMYKEIWYKIWVMLADILYKRTLLSKSVLIVSTFLLTFLSNTDSNI